MKITYVAMYYPPHTGGLELVAQKQAESALQAGHEVSVVTFALKRADIGTVFEKGVLITRVRGLHFFDRYFKIPFCIGGVGLFRALAREIRAADVVHVHDVFYMSSWVAYLFTRLYHKPFVLTQHVALVVHTNKFVMWVQRMVYGVIGARLFRATKAIVVYNPIVREFLVNDLKVEQRKIVEVRNGISIAQYTPVTEDEKVLLRKKLNLPQNKTLVLFVGRFVPKKGYRELYDARGEDFDIVFVGSGALPRSWYDESGVHILGERTQVEMRDIYAAVDIFVSPTQGELFTLTMQEAFASGLPVITTRELAYESCGLPLSSFILCERTPEVLRSEIRTLMRDEKKMNTLGEAARELAETYFDWDKNIQNVLSLYSTIVCHTKKVFVTTSWDDGHVLDLKLATLLSTYGLTGTFYIAPHNTELSEGERLSESDLRTLAQNFEIGAHTMSHRSLTTLDDTEAYQEIITSKQYLEDMLGKEVLSFCYPRGAYCKEHVQMVAQAGFSYARTVRRFAVRAELGKPFETPTTVHTFDHWSDIWGVLLLAHFNLFEFFRLYRKWDKIAVTLFDKVLQTGGVFHLWGHSWEIRDHGDWERLEKVLQHISHRTGVHYVTNTQTYE